MNKMILGITSVVLMLAASTSAHSAPISSADIDTDSISAIQTMPLAQSVQDGVYLLELDELDRKRVANDNHLFDDSPEAVEGFWKTKS